MTTDPKTLARLEELEAKASPAPWERDANETTSDEVHNYMASADNKCLFDSLNSDTRVIDYDVDDGRAYYRDIGTRDDFDFTAALRNAARSLISDSKRLAAAEATITDLRRKLAIAGVEGSPPPGGGAIPNLVARVRELEEAVRVLADECFEWRLAHVCSPVSLIDAPIIRARKRTMANPVARAAVSQKEAG